ncbi:MAG: GAP family protein [Mycobacterium sp.]|uniref:GAP family protein n=1 Tax=Mycobacterium sp. TaxID=1785 RepID=UPI001ED4BFD1|nr:GAP family protein [Mycobacterium sp.]MBV8787294.1 GAP family protein [Mycobacterium sp.]
MMWGTVLAIALWVSIDPTRLVIGGVLMSRPRPKHNLFAYWLGGLAAGVAPGVGAFVLLHGSLLAVLEHARSTVARFTGGYFQIALGVLVLLIAAGVSAYGSASSAPTLQPTPNPSARVIARMRDVLQGGNPWVAFGIGVVSTMPPIDYLFVLIIIVSSGAAVGTQLGAVVLFTVVVLVLVEVPLVSYLVMPARTEAAMLQLHGWAVTHRRRILIIVPAVAGLMLVSAGISSI